MLFGLDRARLPDLNIFIAGAAVPLLLMLWLGMLYSRIGMIRLPLGRLTIGTGVVMFRRAVGFSLLKVLD